MLAVVFLFSFLSIALSQIQSPLLLRFRKLDLPSTAIGPVSIAFDPFGGGPYTGISDGRVVQYRGSTFVDRYFTSPNRSSLVCDGLTQNSSRALGVTCGRPIGVKFYKLRNEAYIADAFRGLLVVNTRDRLAIPVSTDRGGQPFNLLNGIDVDQITGDVYFTDFSAIFGLSQIAEAIAANDSTGRLLKYIRRTKQVTVLLPDLAGATGVMLSPDRRYVIVSEYLGKRVQKLWLSGPRASQSETLVTLKGRPDKINMAPLFGGFWVAVSEESSMGIIPKAIRINGNGNILQSFDLSKNYPNTSISAFHQRGGQYYVGSLETDFVGVYN